MKRPDLYDAQENWGSIVELKGMEYSIDPEPENLLKTIIPFSQFPSPNRAAIMLNIVPLLLSNTDLL